MRLALEALLFENGFEAVLLRGGDDFRALGSSPGVDLVLIDLKLDGESGLVLAVEIRTRFDLPIVMLTGVGDEIDKIVGLEIGADDYLMKPFNPRELVARLRAVLRRYGSAAALPEQGRKEGQQEPIRFGDMRLNREARQLEREGGDEISLTNAEYRLLDYFLRYPETIIPRPRLLAELGSELSQNVDRTIDVLILRLRRKIEKVPSKPVHLQTRRGQGYIFVRGNARDAP
ncbi:MAG: response regulator transcription factor [Rhodobacteraceae bacterium]|nr:response regulator transcription factor [Paracoccaceae bacterium]